MARSFLQTLVVRGLLSPVDAERVAALERIRPTLPLLTLHAEGRIEEDALVRAIGERCELSSVAAEEVLALEPSVLEPFRASWLHRWGVLPLRLTRRGDLVLGMVDPALHEARVAVAGFLSLAVVPVVLPPSLMDRAMRAFGVGTWSLRNSALLEPSIVCDSRGIRALGPAESPHAAASGAAGGAGSSGPRPRVTMASEPGELLTRLADPAVAAPPAGRGELDVTAEHAVAAPLGHTRLRTDPGQREGVETGEAGTVEGEPSTLINVPRTGPVPALTTPLHPMDTLDGGAPTVARHTADRAVVPLQLDYLTRDAAADLATSPVHRSAIELAITTLDEVSDRDLLAEELVDSLAMAYPNVLMAWVRGDTLQVAAASTRLIDAQRLVRLERRVEADSPWGALIGAEEVMQGLFLPGDPVRDLFGGDSVSAMTAIAIRIGSRTVAALVLDSAGETDPPVVGPDIQALHETIVRALRRLILDRKDGR